MVRQHVDHSLLEQERSLLRENHSIKFKVLGERTTPRDESIEREIFSFCSFRKCFPEYQGKDEYTEASEYIQAQFVAQNKSEQKVRLRLQRQNRDIFDVF